MLTFTKMRQRQPLRASSGAENNLLCVIPQNGSGSYKNKRPSHRNCSPRCLIAMYCMLPNLQNSEAFKQVKPCYRALTDHNNMILPWWLFVRFCAACTNHFGFFWSRPRKPTAVYHAVKWSLPLSNYCQATLIGEFYNHHPLPGGRTHRIFIHFMHKLII